MTSQSITLDIDLLRKAKKVLDEQKIPLGCYWLHTDSPEVKADIEAQMKTGTLPETTSGFSWFRGTQKV